MLNSVPESMRACLIEAAKLAGPAFKRKAADHVAPGAVGSGSGPLSFNITVDAGRAPPAPASAGAIAAFAAAAAGGGVSAAGLPPAESDPLISGLVVGGLGSDALLGPIPPLPALPMAVPSLPLPVSHQQTAAAAAAGQAQDGNGGDQDQLLDMLRWAADMGRCVLSSS